MMSKKREKKRYRLTYAEIALHDPLSDNVMLQREFKAKSDSHIIQRVANFLDAKNKGRALFRYQKFLVGRIDVADGKEVVVEI